MPEIFDLIVLFLCLSLLLVISRFSLWFAFLLSSVLLGFLTLPFAELTGIIYNVLSNKSILFLSIAVGLIPVIGGVMEKGGIIDALIESLHIPRRLYAALAPSALGMLPVPGGALLSAPLLDRIGDDLMGDKKAAINVYFRHVLILIYPLGTLLATTKMAGVSLYGAVLFTIPFFIIMGISGYFFLLMRIEGRMPGFREMKWRTPGIPLLIVLIPPIVHTFLMKAIPDVPGEIHLVAGVTTSILAGVFFGRLDLRGFKNAFLEAKVWRYTFLILAVFIFMYVFKATTIAGFISKLTSSKFVLVVFIGSALGFLTGRVNLPVALMVPILAALPEEGKMKILDFSILHFSIFVGYVISPVHPCILVSLQYFKTSYLSSLKHMLIPSVICFLAVVIIAAAFL